MQQGLPVDLDLTGVYAKLARAEEHFKTVHDEITKWMQSSRYEPFVERGNKGTRIGIGLCQIGPPPDLIRWALILGDCVNNLRSTLDHLIIAFTKLNAAYNPAAKRKRVTFVIIDDPAEFAKALEGNLEGFTPKFADLLKSLQPFIRTHPQLPPLLSIIRDLSNADKHRLLQVAAAGVVATSGIFVGDTGRGNKSLYTNPDPIQHNDIVCVIESSEPDPHLAIDSFTAHVEVAIWHDMRDGSTNPLDGRTVYYQLIPLLISEVKFVIDQFKFAI